MSQSVDNQTKQIWDIVLTLSDRQTTLNTKLHHKEITYDEYEEHSKRYDSEAHEAVKNLLAQAELKGRIDEMYLMPRPNEHMKKYHKFRIAELEASLKEIA